MELSINFNFFLISKIDSQIHTQKINFFLFLFFYSYLKFARDLQNTQTQIHTKFKTQTQTKTFEYFWVHMYVEGVYIPLSVTRKDHTMSII